MLGQYLARHYKEAKKAIVTLEAELYILSNELGCVGEDQFKQYLTAEKEHFAHLEQTSPLIQTKVKYVQSLKKLKKAQCVTLYLNVLCIFYPELVTNGKRLEHQ